MIEKIDKILNQIKKELEGIKKEIKKSNALKDTKIQRMAHYEK
tara:strand:- start:18 stop:146 length:129 start_codon:yes stop_codon:yes gene_type:complete